MRAFLVLLLAGCTAPEVENCLLHGSTALTEGEAAGRVTDGGVLLSLNPECSCVRDHTVSPGPADAAARGYCAAPCELPCASSRCAPCPAGTQCTEVGSTTLCLRLASP